MTSSSSYIIGVDEAGRGPVIGDMVIVAAAYPRSLEPKLVELGVRNSKKLSPSSREHVLKSILGTGVLLVVAYVPPWILDSENLNDAEARYILKALELCAKILRSRGVRELEVYVDEVLGRSMAIEEQAKRALGFAEHVVVRVEKDADEKYPAVSMASIAAKVSRDRALKLLKKLAGDFGSGYPSDPATRNWIRAVHEKLAKPPPFVRKTWSTLKTIAPKWYIVKGKGKQRSLLDFAKGG